MKGYMSNTIIVDELFGGCNNCAYHYELTEEQKENYEEYGMCGCKALDESGRCAAIDWISAY